ncbi:MAG: UDP-N-acetylmuramoyl-L-alanine--D-glutamate ligase [Alphaproteobacteria bacterium]
MCLDEGLLMISVPFFRDQTVFVLGLGRSGVLTAQVLQKSGAKVLGWDDNPKAREAAHAQGIALQAPSSLDWAAVQGFILSPGIPHRYPAPHPAAVLAELQGLVPIGDIECFFRAKLQASAVAITGTNGKSTTTALVAHLIQQAGFPAVAAGNIGVPALELSPLPSHGFYVLELSSYQLELTPSLELACAVLLNISPDHLERHGGMEGYIAAKRKIFRRAKSGVLGIDDEKTQAILDEISAGGTSGLLPQRRVFISAKYVVEGGISCIDGVLYDDLDRASPCSFSLEKAISLQGPHNHQNAAAAYAVGRILGLSSDVLKQGLLSFKGLAHRQEYVGLCQGVHYYNDSKATNPEAAEKALSTLGPRHTLYWIVGGRPKQQDLGALKHVFSYVKQAFVIGEAVELFSSLLQERGIPHKLSYTLEAACAQAHQQALEDQAPNPLVLLSPACTSFDQFRDFEQRGDSFKAWVHKLPDFVGPGF